MPRRGYIRLARNAVEHPFFRRKEYSEFEAWVWMINEAAWKQRQRRIGDFLVPLERGQMAASVRHLGEFWNWSKSRVDRYLGRLKTETMISISVDRGITVVTICNYGRYQDAMWDDGEAPADDFETVPGQDRDSAGTGPGRERDNTETLKHSNIETVKDISNVTATQLALIDDPVAEKPKRTRRSKKPVVTPEIQAGFDAWWAACPLKIAKDRAFPLYVEIVSNGKASIGFLHSQMLKYYADEEQRFVIRRYSEPWQYSYQPVAWLRDGHYGNEVAPIAGGQARPMSSASEGVRSYLDQ